MILKLFLIFGRFEPRCSYKVCSYKTSTGKVRVEELGSCELGSWRVSKLYFIYVRRLQKIGFLYVFEQCTKIIAMQGFRQAVSGESRPKTYLVFISFVLGQT